MAIPDLLKQHIEQLRADGYKIDVIEEQEIGIVIRHYPVPNSIWSSDKVDLLIVAHPSYPNAKMDMFWVDPTITLQNGGVPSSTGSASKFGKTWQQFSWHVNSWNPAHDNLVTYLDVVNDRLRRNQ